MLGFVAENVLKGIVKFSPWNIEETNKDAVLLDVREDAELLAYSLPGAKHIPLGQLRSRLGELDPSKEYITFCAIGVRSYNAGSHPEQHGFGNVSVYPAGTRFYQSTHYEEVSPCRIRRTNPSTTAATRRPRTYPSRPCASTAAACSARPDHEGV